MHAQTCLPRLTGSLGAFVSGRTKGSNGCPYLIVDFARGFWRRPAGWRWRALAGWRSPGRRGPPPTRSCGAWCPAATWARPRKPASCARGRWRRRAGRPAPCTPAAPRSWRPSPGIRTGLRPFSSLWRSEACERCHCLGLSLSGKLQVKKNIYKGLHQTAAFAPAQGRDKALVGAVRGLAGAPKSIPKVSLVLGCDSRLHHPGMTGRQSPLATWSRPPGCGCSSGPAQSPAGPQPA